MKYKLKSSLLITFFLITNLCYGQLTTTAVQDTQNVSDGDSTTTTTTTTTTATTDAATPIKGDGFIPENTNGNNCNSISGAHPTCPSTQFAACSAQPIHNFQSADTLLKNISNNLYFNSSSNPQRLVQYINQTGYYHQEIRFDIASVRALFNQNNIALAEKLSGGDLNNYRAISTNYIQTALSNQTIKPSQNPYDIPLLGPNQSYTKELLAHYYMRLDSTNLKTAYQKKLVGDCRITGRSSLTLDPNADIACSKFLLTKTTKSNGSWPSNIRCVPNSVEAIADSVGCYHGMRAEVCQKQGDDQGIALLQDAITTSLDPSGQDLCNFTAMANKLNALKNAPKMTIESIVSDANIKFFEGINGQIECFLKLPKALADKISAGYKYNYGGADYIALRSDHCSAAHMRVSKAAYTDSLANVSAVPMLEPLDNIAAQVASNWNSNAPQSAVAMPIEMIPYNPASVTKEVFHSEFKTIPETLMSKLNLSYNSKIHVYRSNQPMPLTGCSYNQNPYPYSGGSYQGCDCVSSTATSSENQAVQ